MTPEQLMAEQISILSTLTILEQTVLIMYPKKGMTISTEIRKNFYDGSMRMGYYGNISNKLIFFISKVDEVYTFELCQIGGKLKQLPDPMFASDNANQQILLGSLYNTITSLHGIEKIT